MAHNFLFLQIFKNFFLLICGLNDLIAARLVSKCRWVNDTGTLFFTEKLVYSSTCQAADLQFIVLVNLIILVKSANNRIPYMGLSDYQQEDLPLQVLESKTVLIEFTSISLLRYFLYEEICKLFNFLYIVFCWKN